MKPTIPRPLILGHRGAPLDAPENTLLSFRLAVEQGADGVELDVQPSADGVPVVIHDDTVDRTTNGVGRVDVLTGDELKRLDAGVGQTIPTLCEVADWAARSGAWLNVELKAAGNEAEVVEVLERAGVMHRTILSSFVPAAVEAVGRLAPDLRRYLLAEEWDREIALAADRIGAQGVCLHDQAATGEVLPELADAGLPAIIWTVDDPARIRHLLHAGVAGIITNRPALAAAIRRGTVRPIR